jgi:tRNA splicing endonuclease
MAFQGSERARKLRTIKLKAERKASRLGEAQGIRTKVPASIAGEPITRNYLKRIGTEERHDPLRRMTLEGEEVKPELSPHWTETTPPGARSSGKTLAEKLRAKREPPVEREMPGRKVSFKPRAPGAPVEDVIAQSAKQGYLGPGNREGIQEMMYQRENPYGTHPTRQQLVEAGVADTDNPLKDIDPEDAAKGASSFMAREVKDPQQAGEVEEFVRQHPEIMKQMMFDNYLSRGGRTKTGSNTGLKVNNSQRPIPEAGEGLESGEDTLVTDVQKALDDPERQSTLHAAIPGPEEVLERQQEASPLVRKASSREHTPEILAAKIRAKADRDARLEAQAEKNKVAAPSVPSITRSLRDRPTGIRGGKKTYVGPGRFKGNVVAFPEEDIHELAGASKPNPERRKYSKSLKRIKKGPRGTEVAKEGGDPTDYREGWQKLSSMLRKRKRTPSERNPIPGLGE